MGRKGFETTEKIKKALKNGPISGKVLKTEVQKLWGNNRPSDEKKSIESALIKLLENGTIEIVNYDSDFDKRNQKSKQVITSDPIIFDLTKRLNGSDVSRMLNQLENLELDEKIYKNARKRLRTIFIKKYREYEKNNFKFYNSLLPRVKFISAKEDYVKQMENLNNLANRLYEPNKDLYEPYLMKSASKKIPRGEEWKIVMDPGSNKPKVHPDFKNYHEERKEIQRFYYGINEKSRLWEISNLTSNEAWELIQYKYHQKKPVHDPILEINEDILVDAHRKLEISSGAWIDRDGNGSPETYLNQFNIIAGKMSEEDLVELFNMVLFFVSTHENYKVLKHHLAFALSDEKDSLKWFERFILFAYTEEFTLKFQKDLGISEPKNTF